jgi:uncharacterized protein
MSFYGMTPMKVWADFDTILRRSAGPDDPNECGDEQAECSLTTRDQLFEEDMAGPAPLECLPEGPLQQATSLYVQACSPEHWLACNPAGPGLVAVLDAEALTLLEGFRQPTTLAEASLALPQRSLASIEHGVRLLARADLLLPVGSGHQPLPRPPSRESQTLSAWLHVTNACNLACSYCYLQKSAEHMSSETGRGAVETVFRSAARYGYRGVHLKYAGGEASLRPQQVFALHDYATQLASEQHIRLSAYVMSNGVVLSQRFIEGLQQRQIGIMISLDGVGQHHDRQRPFRHGPGSFAWVDRSISRLLAAGLVPHINVTVSRRNLAGLPALMEYLLERDLPFSLSYYRENECSASLTDLQFGTGEMIRAMRAAFAVIEQRLPKRRLLGSLIDRAHPTRPQSHTCGMGRHYLVIDQHGGISRCHAANEAPVATIESLDPLAAIRRRGQGLHAVPVEEKSGCRSCLWRYWCSGGCPALTYRLTGRLDVQSPNCAIYQALFPEVLRLEALRLLKYVTPLAV